MRNLARLGLVFVGIAAMAQIAFAQSPPLIPAPSISPPDIPTTIVPPQRAPIQNPWYIEGSAGAVWRMDASRSTTFFTNPGGFGLAAPLSGPGTETADFDIGYNLNLGVGYRLPMGFRLEVEGGYIHYTSASVSPKSTDGTFPALNGSQLNVTSGGAHDQYAVTLNAFYDIPISTWCVPYVGAGGGVNFTRQEDTQFAGPGGVPRFTQFGGNSTDAVVLGEVGVAIAMDAKWSVVPSYRFEAVLTQNGRLPNNENIFKLGIRYSP